MAANRFRGYLLFTLALAGCGASPAPAPAAPAAPPPATQPGPARPRCTAADPNAPADAKPVMKQAGEDVKGCFLLGKASAAPSSVAIELSIGEKGAVSSVNASASGAEREQLSCVENTMKKQKFATFCGADVTIRWTYSLAR